MLFRKRTWKRLCLGSMHRAGVRAGVTLGDGEGIKEKGLKGVGRWFFRR